MPEYVYQAADSNMAYHKMQFCSMFLDGNSKEISFKMFWKIFFDKLPPGLWEIQELWKFLSQDAMQKELRIWKCENNIRFR